MISSLYLVSPHSTDDIGILERAGHETHHHLLHFVGGGEDAWQVGVDDLEIFAVHDALDAMAGRLRFCRRDAQLLAHQLVHQRALPHIRIPDEVHKTGVMI